MERTDKGMQLEFYRDLFQSSRCGILSIDLEGRVIAVNQVARQILDVPEPPAGGISCKELLKHHPSVGRILVESLQLENPPSRIEIDLRSPGRARRIIGGTVSHLRRENGKRNGAVLFFKDLTHLEQGEERDRLKERLASIGEMAAGLAHEIRNPLVNIGSTATLLKRKLVGNDSGILALDTIVQEVRRLNQAVTQCLEYAKPVNLTIRTVQLPLVLEEVVAEVRSRWPRGGVKVSQSFDERIIEVRADEFQLRQVFHNVVTNAFEAMNGSGTLEVNAYLETLDRGGRAIVASQSDEESSRFAVVSIKDSGRGIPPEVKERLFFPFFTTKPGGSGIGLAVAKKIVDSHRGVIDVESEPGLGATFIVKLPISGAGSGLPGRNAPR